MKMQAVRSSEIDLIGYDEHTHKMRVSFRQAKPADFYYVPKEVFSAFLNARSKNRFFKRHILNHYSC